MDNPLDRYLKSEGISEAVFAERVERDRSIINKLRSGKLKASVHLALAVERASEGAIDAAALNATVAMARTRPTPAEAA